MNCMKHTLTAAAVLTAAFALTPRASASATLSVPAAAGDSAVTSGQTAVDYAARLDSVRRAVHAPLVLPDFSLGVSHLPVGRQATVQPPDRLIPVNIVGTEGHYARGTQQSIYSLPYSLTRTCHDWKRLWINTGVLTGAFVGTLFVLELLPEDATSWNRASLQNVPLFKRWKKHVITEGPEWDHDKFVFNYVLHPYAGAAYFMAARSVGFNFYQSLLYSTIISNIGWEFGIEAFMERPSYQDLFITPLIGSALGEGFYRLKRKIVNDGYELLGSPFLGGLVAFFIDPVNEVVGYFGHNHNPARTVAEQKERERRQRMGPHLSLVPGLGSLALKLTF